MKCLTGVIFVLILLPSLVSAQNLKIEALRPQFELNNGKPTTLTSVWFVTVSVPVYKKITFVGQLPFAFAKLKDTSLPREDETIGNPAIGLRFDHERLTIDAGVRVPIVKNGFAGFVGALADIDRQEAFVPDILPLYGMIRTKIDVGRFSIIPYGGVSFTLKTEHERNEFFARVFKRRENDGELFILYGAEGWVKFGVFNLGAAYSARTWATSGGAFSASSINQIGVQAKLVFEKFVPGVLFRFPLDDILLDYTAGINFEIIL
jgi:hypothetical protein